MKVKSESEVTQSCPTPSDPMDCREAPPSMGFSRQEYWSASLVIAKLLVDQNSIFAIVCVDMYIYVCVCVCVYIYIFI